jgi:superfamily I DNA/RNA helicase
VVDQRQADGADGADGTDGAPAAPADPEVIALQLALDHLVDAEGILPEEILVITCRSQKHSRWYSAEQRQIGKHRLIQRPEGGRPGRVALSTVRSAKGLERKVVILTELDGLDETARDHTRRDTLLYVAISRAVHHLVVLGPEKALQPRKSGVLALIHGGR